MNQRPDSLPRLTRFRWLGLRLCGQLSSLVLVCLSVLAAATPETKPPVRVDFSSFKLITDRNIFNSTRSPRRAGDQAEARAPQVDTITLYGTFIYEKGPFAFFTGSRPEFKQVLNAGKSIAGFTITQVTGSGVRLAAGTNAFDLHVGMELRREEGGEWQVAGGLAQASSSHTSPAAGTASSSSSDESDVVKRMMKQREEELK